MRSAWKVGAFVVIFGAMLVGVLATLRASLFAKRFDNYYAQFDDVGGLTVGSVVLQSGVQVGEVAEVGLNAQNKAIVRLAIEQGRKVPVGTSAVLPTSFIAIGDKQLLLVAPSQPATAITPNDSSQVIPGRLMGPLEGVLPDTSNTMKELNKTLVAVQDLLGDQGLRGSLKNVLDSGSTTATKFGTVADTLNSTISRNGKSLDSMMASMAKTLSNLQDVSVEVKRIATDGKLEAQANEILTTVAEAAKEGKSLVQDLRAWTTDPELKDSLKTTLANFETMSHSGVRIAQDGELIAANGVEVTEQTKQLLTKANKLADEVERLLAEFKGTVGKIIPNGATNLLPKINFEADMTYNTADQRLRNDLTLQFPAGSQTFLFGFYDAFESNKLILQLEKEVREDLFLRYGVYAAKPGVGVSYSVAPNLWLRGDLFGLNDPQLDLRLRYDFSGGWHAWAGIESLFGRNTPSLGFGIKK